ncbi:hypothetical protein ACLOJK_000718 [Asimina triloba]
MGRSFGLASSSLVVFCPVSRTPNHRKPVARFSCLKKDSRREPTAERVRVSRPWMTGHIQESYKGLNRLEEEALLGRKFLRTLLIDNYDSYTYNIYQELSVVNGALPNPTFGTNMITPNPITYGAAANTSNPMNQCPRTWLGLPSSHSPVHKIALPQSHLLISVAGVASALRLAVGRYKLGGVVATVWNISIEGHIGPLQKRSDTTVSYRYRKVSVGLSQAVVLRLGVRCSEERRLLIRSVIVFSR